MYMPALPLARTIALGPWRLGPLRNGFPWRSEGFRSLATALIESWVKEHGPGAILWHVDRGIDGVPPNTGDWLAIELSVTFALLDRNDSVRRDANAGHLLGTAENGRVVVQPIDVKQGFITHGSGGFLRSVLDGGHRIGEAPPPIGDATVRILQRVELDERLCQAAYARIRRHGARGERLATVMEWHASAMQNARAATLQQRIIALKTGFEALAGLERANSRKEAAAIRGLFERATRRHRAFLPWSGLLWSPLERTDIARIWTEGAGRKVRRYTDLEDWYMRFADVRNGIIHEGVISALEYKSPRKTRRSDRHRYDGNFFWTAERLLREGVKACLGAEVLLRERVEERRLTAKLGELLRQEIRSKHEAAEAAGVALPPAGVATGRTVNELLRHLRARAPGDIQVAHREPESASVLDEWGDADAADVVTHSSGRRWVARSDLEEVVIEEDEAFRLISAGAALED